MAGLRLPPVCIGTLTLRKPRRAASAMRASTRATERTSPPSPTSPTKTASVGSGRLRTDDATAAMTARSAAGSVTFSPPATFRKMSCPAAEMPARRSRTQRSMASRRLSKPVATRWGRANGVAAASAWTSTSRGRVPSTVATTAEPETSGRRPERKNSDGLATSDRPPSVISKTPISLVEPYRFLAARTMRYCWKPSPSK